MAEKRTTARRFIMNGFSQDLGCRHFAFEVVEEDHSRAEFKVRADLSLTRTYGIVLQDLPLLCRELLERQYEDSREPREILFTEADMRQLRDDRLAAKQALALARKSPRRPSPANAGKSWRTTMAQQVASNRA